mgnify:CR=1 FL=1
MEAFEKWYETVLERVQRFFSGTVANHADKSFPRAWARAYYDRLGPEEGMIHAVAALALIFAEDDFSVADVDYSKLKDPEDRLSVLLPAGHEAEFSTLYAHTCMKMHQHNLAKGVSYPQYSVQHRIDELRAQIDEAELSTYGETSTEDWWEE